MCIEENLDCPINKILINNNESYYSENSIKFNTINLKNIQMRVIIVRLFQILN